MKVTETRLKGLFIIEPIIFADDRGYFFETYSKTKFADAGIDIDFIQDNQSFSHKGAVRGLHTQKAPNARRVVLSYVVQHRRESRLFPETHSV